MESLRDHLSPQAGRGPERTEGVRGSRLPKRPFPPLTLTLFPHAGRGDLSQLGPRGGA